MKTPEQRQWHRFAVFIVDFDHILQSVTIVEFEQVNSISDISILCA